MKLLLFSLLTFISFGYFAQSSQLGFYVPVSFPNKTVMPNMSTNAGFGLSYGYSPFWGSKMYFELKTNWSNYSTQTLSQTYMFSDSTQTTTDVTYSSNMSRYLLGGKVMLNGDYRAIRVFVTPQFGLVKMKSKIVVADPQDEDQCQPLERKTTQKDLGFAYGGEIGAEFDMNRIFKGIAEENKHKIVLSLNYLSSTRHFEYVNIKYMQDEVHDMNAHPSDLTSRFINVSTNAIHEHKIAELYHTPLSMLGFNVGYTICF